MKNIALNDTHESLGAKMVPFAGYNMPVQYEGVKAEHETVRKSVGVFDVSHMGEFLISGVNALDLIQKISSNDASTLTIGRAQYSCMPNGKGGIVDDLIIYKIKEEEYLLVVNASNIDKDWDWISSHNSFKGLKLLKQCSLFRLLTYRRLNITILKLPILQVLSMLSFQLQGTLVLAGLKFIAKIMRLRRFGTKSWRLGQHLV